MRVSSFVLHLVLFFSTCFTSMGQVLTVEGRVVDKESKFPLQYTNIVVLNYPFGITSDQNGFFRLTLDEMLRSDTLVFSYVGYEHKRICIENIENSVIELQPKTYHLNSFLVMPASRKNTQIVLNRFIKKDCFVPYTNSFASISNVWFPYRPEEPSIEAIYFPLENDRLLNYRLKEVVVLAKSFSLPSEFRLRIFNASSINQPDTDLLTENLILVVNKREQLLRIDLEPYNLYFPKNGLFVGFELLIKPENFKKVVTPDGQDTITLLSPFLQYVETDELDYKQWLYTKGRWNKHIQKSHLSTERRQLFLKPAITLILSQ